MSLSPADHPQPSAGLANSGTSAAHPAVGLLTRASRLWTICFILLTLEVGGFLAIFPWIDAWHLNHFRAYFPYASELWDDPYFRGAVTGLGVTNLLVAFGQFVHLIRSARKPRL